MIVCIIINIISCIISCFYFSFKNFYGVFTVGNIIKEYISYLIIFLIINSIMLFIKHLFDDENNEDKFTRIIKNKNTIRWLLIQLLSYIITLVIMHIILL